MGSGSSKRVSPIHVDLNGDCPRVGAEGKFVIIDEHARKAPKTLVTSDVDLVAYLCRNVTDDVNKIRAFYTWIITNKRQLLALCPDVNKQGDVFADKLHALSSIAGIQSKIMKGLHKIPTENVNTNTSIHANHRWNVVKLAGKWHVVDCHCGARDILLESFYFLPDPRQFISNHFPLDDDPSWQLLQEPITLEDFNSAPVVSEFATSRGVRVVLPKTRILNVRHSFDVSVVDAHGTLTDFTAVLCSEDGLSHDGFVFISRTDRNTYMVNVRPPFVGNFRLTLQGKLTITRIETITEFIVVCSTVKKHTRKFPKEYETWGIETKFPELLNKLCPMSQTFQEVKDGSLDFSISTKTKLRVYASLRWLEEDQNLDEYINTETGLSQIKLKSLLPKKGFYRVCVYVRGEGLLYPVLYLLVENKKVAQCPAPIVGYTKQDILI